MQLKAVERPKSNEEKIEETIRQVQLLFCRHGNMSTTALSKREISSLLDVDVIEDDSSTQPFFTNSL